MAVNWSRYDACEICDASPGEPCYDMRMVRMPNWRSTVRVAIPHKTRALLTEDRDGEWQSQSESSGAPKS